MRLKNYILNNKASGLILLLSILTLTSCGSYQYVAHDDDGIYENQPNQPQHTPRTVEKKSNGYYEQYFSEKSTQYGEIPEEGAIFTDIDSYASDQYEVDTTSIVGYSEGRPAWGSASDEVAINIYNTGFRPFYGYGWGFGLGYYNYGYGYYNPWNFNPYWNTGWYYGNPFYCPPFYSYYSPYRYYNRPYRYYNSPYIAYNRYNRNVINRSRYGTSYRSRYTNYNSRSRSRANINSNSRYRSRSNATINNRSRSRSNSAYDRSRTRTRTYSPRTRSNSSYRSRQTPSRSRSNYSRSRSSNRSSSSSFRSRSSSSRSSGTRSSGSRSRSRGGRG